MYKYNKGHASKKQHTQEELRGKLSKSANEKIKEVKQAGNSFFVELKDGYKFAEQKGNFKANCTMVNTIKELKEVTKLSNIVEVKKEAPKAEEPKFNQNEVRERLTENANAHLISLWHGDHYSARLARGYKLAGHKPNENGAYDFDTVSDMISALNFAGIAMDTDMIKADVKANKDNIDKVKNRYCLPEQAAYIDALLEIDNSELSEAFAKAEKDCGDNSLLLKALDEFKGSMKYLEELSELDETFKKVKGRIFDLVKKFGVWVVNRTFVFLPYPTHQNNVISSVATLQDYVSHFGNKKLKDGTLVMTGEEWRAIREHCEELRLELRGTQEGLKPLKDWRK